MTEENVEDADIAGYEDRRRSALMLRGAGAGVLVTVLGLVGITLNTPLPDQTPDIESVRVVDGDNTTVNPEVSTAEVPAAAESAGSGSVTDGDSTEQAAVPTEPVQTDQGETTAETQEAATEDAKTEDPDTQETASATDGDVPADQQTGDATATPQDETTDETVAAADDPAESRALDAADSQETPATVADEVIEDVANAADEATSSLTDDASNASIDDATTAATDDAASETTSDTDLGSTEVETTETAAAIQDPVEATTPEITTDAAATDPAAIAEAPNDDVSIEDSLRDRAQSELQQETPAAVTETVEAPTEVEASDQTGAEEQPPADTAETVAADAASDAQAADNPADATDQASALAEGETAALVEDGETAALVETRRPRRQPRHRIRVERETPQPTETAEANGGSEDTASGAPATEDVASNDVVAAETAPDEATPEPSASDDASATDADTNDDAPDSAGEDTEIAALTPTDETPEPGQAVTGEAVIALNGPALDVNGRAYDAPADAPLLAVVLEDAAGGRIGAETLPLLTMPLTFSIRPGQAGSRAFAEAARAANHEVLSELPIEPLDGSGGPEDLLTSMSPDEIRARTTRYMAELDMAVGATTPGGTYSATDMALMDSVLDTIHQHGFAYVDIRSGLGGVARRIAGETGVPYVHSNRSVPAGTSGEQIYQMLESAAFRARREGTAVLVISGEPAALQALLRWGLERDRRPVWFAPISAVIQRRTQAE